MSKPLRDWTADEKNSGRFFASIALKYNIKAGGINHKLITTTLQSPKDSCPIFVGISVTRLASSSYSITGIVANTDCDLGQSPGSVRYQEGPGEIVKDLETMMKERFQEFVRKQPKPTGKPTKIIVYRGGVSETHYQRVLEEEFPKIQKARDLVYPGGPKPQITMLIVSNHHQYRFHDDRNGYVKANGEANGDTKNGNSPKPGTNVDCKVNDGRKKANYPKPGTILDRVHKVGTGWDFFLQSHPGSNGNVSPSSILRYSHTKIIAGETRPLRRHQGRDKGTSFLIGSRPSNTAF